VNPIEAGVLLVFALAATWAPWRRSGWRAPGRGLWVEGAALVAAVAVGVLVGGLVVPTDAGFRWGRVALYVAAYWYACAGGMAVVRMVLELVPVAAQPPSGGIAVSATELARGRMIGVLERAVALTLVLLGQFGALGLLIAAKALARFRALDDRDFAEYFLIGTLASLLQALVVGVGVRLLT
jgi:hypothetical protein